MKNWLQIASIVLNVVLLVFVLRLNGEMKTLQYELSQELERTEERISDALYEVQHTLETAEELHTDYGMSLTGIDMESQSFLADAFVQFEHWGTDLAATLCVTQGEVTAELPMTHEGNGRFTVPVSLKETGRIQLAVLVTENGVAAREELGSWEDIVSFLPLQMNAWGYNNPVFRGGKLTIGEIQAFLKDRGGNYVEAEDAEFRVYLNGDFVKRIEAQYDPQKGYRAAEDVVLTEVDPWNYVWVTFACQDEYGLRYEFPVNTWTEGEPPPSFGDTHAGGRFNGPALTWK